MSKNCCRKLAVLILYFYLFWSEAALKISVSKLLYTMVFPIFSFFFNFLMLNMELYPLESRNSKCTVIKFYLELRTYEC